MFRRFRRRARHAGRPGAAARSAAVLLALGAVLLAACSNGSTSQSTTSLGTGGTTPTGATTSGGPTGASSGSLHWHSCDQRFQCAALSVPLSYTDAGEGTIDIQVVRLPATGAHPIGDLIMNPGGPGASGISFLESAWQSFPSALRERFALVSFDPRGIGASDPVNCLSPAQIRAYLAVDPAPTTPAQIATVIAATKGFVADCEASTSAKLLANVSTADTARDMDRLRAALGDDKLTYLGYSYGTYLGAVYAELFPTHVRALVLDGDFPPSLSTATLDEQQALGFEQDLQDFLNWCGTSSQCGAISSSGDPSGTFEQLMTRFENGLVLTASLPASLGGNEQVNLGIAEIGVIAGLYSPSSWPELGQSLAEAEQGNGTDLALFAAEYAGEQQNGTYQNIISANVAISCLDRPVPTSLSAVESLADRIGAVAPDFGASEAWSGLTCAYWPDKATSGPFRLHVPGLPPVLVIGSTHDPATPYVWAKEMSAQLPGSVLLTRDGDGHTAYQFSSCIRSWADSYLISLALPPAGTVCQSDGSGLP